MTKIPFPDSWFARHEPAFELPYVGMSRQEARSAASSDGVAEIRVMEIPLRSNTAFTADLRPHRLNLLVVEGRVVRAAFF